MTEADEKFYNLLDDIEQLCVRKGELSFDQLESMCLAKEIRPSAILDELAISEGYRIDYTKGKVICHRG